MKLFDLVPQNFFSVLASKNKEIYLDALLVLHHLFKQAINVDLEEYVSVLVANMEDILYEMETDDLDNAEGQSLSSSQKARLLIKKFTDTGWIDAEYKEGSFERVIALRDYAIKVLNLLDALTELETKEYNSLVFNTYSSLKQAQEDTDRMYDALLGAKRNTQQLIDELKSLYHNIRRYHQQINDMVSVNELLQGHFDSYKKMIDRIYHPIKTMDSIHRYRIPISDLLTDILGNDEIVENMCKRAMTIKSFTDIPSSKISIIDDITFVLDAYESLQRIIDEIYSKHSAYTRNSIEKMQYLLTADRSIKSKLAEMLTRYSKANEKDKDELLALYQKRIRVSRQEFIDSKSLYTQNNRNRKDIGEPLMVISADSGIVEDELSDIITRAKNSYSLPRIKSYMKELLEISPVITTGDIAFVDDNDFILVMLATIRASDRGMSYTVEYLEGYIDSGGYKVPNIRFCRKDI